MKLSHYLPEQQQLNFINYIQRLLVEGDFSATYKYALLHAIADCCIEMAIDNENDELIISFDALVDKMIILYWHHASPFSDAQTGQDGLLFQNAGSQSKVITELYFCQQQNIRTINALKQSQYWQPIYKATLQTLKDGPLWRLQKLAKVDECFLYPHIKGQKYIKLNAGIAACFRRFYDLVVHLAKNAWLLKIQSIKQNQHIIGAQSQLYDFLFGVDRVSLAKAAPVLKTIQQGNCFYCNKPLSTQSEVDHFIPFARYAHDLGHNFVLAHKGCNNAKRDLLAAPVFKDKWIDQNLVINEHIITSELSPYFYCNPAKSLSITEWAYDVVSKTGGQYWHPEKHAAHIE
jgi:hypothetical protein